MADLTHCQAYVLGYVESRTEGSDHGRRGRLVTRGEMAHLSLVMNGFFSEKQVYDALDGLVARNRVFKHGPHYLVSEMEILR